MITREGGNLAFGIAIGIFVCIPVLALLDFVRLPFTVNDTIIGAIVGGSIAGLVSLGAQSLVILDNLKRVEEAKHAKQMAYFESIFVKLQDCVDHFQKLRNYYSTHDKLYLIRINDDSFLWKPLFGSSHILSLSIEEKATLLNTRNSDLYNKVGDFQRLSESVKLLHGQYAAKFYAFEQRMKEGGIVRVDGRTVISEGPSDPMGLLETQDVLEHLRNALKRGVPIGHSSFEKVRIILAEKYNLNIEIDFEEDISGAAQ